MTVQVVSQDSGVISHDARSAQLVRCFKIRLLVKAPKHHLQAMRGTKGEACFQTLSLEYCGALTSIGTSWYAGTDCKILGNLVFYKFLGYTQ